MERKEISTHQYKEVDVNRYTLEGILSGMYRHKCGYDIDKMYIEGKKSHDDKTRIN